MPEHDIDPLIAAYLEGALSAQQADRFSAWLTADPANARYVAKLGLVERGLNQHFLSQGTTDLLAELAEMEASAGAVVPVDKTDEFKKRRLEEERQKHMQDPARRGGHPQDVVRPLVIPKPLAWLGLAAVLGLVATLAVYFGQPAPNDTPPRETAAQTPGDTTPAPTPSSAVAQVRSSVDAQWAGGRGATHTGLAAEVSVTLTAGLAEVAFNDGATVIVQGPVTFEPTGINGMRLISGRIAATVPGSARGFTVNTPGGLITDYGTEFGVIVNHDGQTLAQAFTGRIGLTPIGGSEVDLPAGDAVVAAPNGRVRPVEPDTLAFVRREEYAARQDADASARARWLAYCYALQRDPEVLGLFLADSARPGRGTTAIPNLAGARGRSVSISDARFVGRANRAEDGLRLDSDSDAFTFEVGDTLDAVTLLMWARMDPDDSRDLRALIGSDENDTTGALHWNLHFAAGTAASRVALRNNSSAEAGAHWPMVDALFEGGQLPVGWHLYAVSINGQSGRVRHYLDGVMLAESELQHRGPLVLGTTRVGAWLMDPDVGDHTRVLRGTVGLVAVVDGARDADQMRALYRHLSQAQSQGGTPPAPPDE